MKKNTSGTVALVALNVALFSILVTRKSSKNFLKDFARHSAKLKEEKEFQQKLISKNIGKEEKLNQKMSPFMEEDRKKEIFEAQFYFGEREYHLFKKTVEEYLLEKLRELKKMEIVLYEPFVYSLAGSKVYNDNTEAFYTVDFKNKKPVLYAWQTLFVSCVFAIALHMVKNFSTVHTEAMDSAIRKEIEFVIENYSFLEDFLEEKSTNPHMPHFEKDNSYENQFKEIMVRNIETEEKVELILNSNATNTQNKFHFLVESSGLVQFQSMEYIVNSSFSYEEKLQFIKEEPKLNLEQKVWYLLQIPNVSFQKLYQEAMTLKGSKEEILSCIIKADIIPFETLFTTILEENTLPQEAYINCIALYSASFNTASIEEKLQFVLALPNISEEKKTSAFYEILSYYAVNNLLEEDLYSQKEDSFFQTLLAYPLDKKSEFILSYYDITYQDYLNLYEKEAKEYTLEEKRIFTLFSKIKEEKKAFVLKFFDNEEEYMDTIRGTAAESVSSFNDYTYLDCYWVANIFFNRCTDSKYREKGTNPYAQFIAPGQFEVYQKRSYEKCSTTDLKYLLAEQAFCDMFYAGYEGISHDYLEFRSSNTVDFSNNQVVKGGNRYGVIMKVNRRIMDENFFNENFSEEEVDSFSLRLTQ